jgi:YD repeat-containing protein
MKRHLHLLFRTTAAVLLLPIALSVAAQQHQNQKKGFNANNVYEFNGLDSINAFNGNLTISIPIGSTYSVGGGLSYGLTLFSNGNLWKGVPHCHEVTQGVCTHVCPRSNRGCGDIGAGLPIYMVPDRRGNAGMGWTLSLGRLFHPDHISQRENTVWTYESPDGADHEFNKEIATDVRVTTDGSNLRMKLGPAPNTRSIEFPDGTIRVFEAPNEFHDFWALQQLKNRYVTQNGQPLNYLNVTYQRVPNMTEPTDGVRWLLTDSHGRQHWIDFAKKTFSADPFAPSVEHSRMVVTGVNLSVFDIPGDNPNPAGRAQYVFQQLERTPSRSEFQTDTFHSGPIVGYERATVQTLESVTLPDQTAYAFKYEGDSGNIIDSAGVVSEVALPTGGLIRWTWGPYQKPRLSSEGTEYTQLSYGVTVRETFGRSVNGVRPALGKRTYVPQLNCFPEAQWPDLQQRCEDFTTTVTEMDVTATPVTIGSTIHYFSGAVTDEVVPWLRNEYGLPFTKKFSDLTPAPNTRYLSTRQLNGSGTVLRSTYVRFQPDPSPDAPVTKYLLASSKTVFDDDGGVYIVSDSTEWDRYGHARTVTSSGTVPGTPTRVVTTNYLPLSTTAIGATSPWILGLHDFASVTENGRTTRTEVCFDAATGFLNRRRMLKSLQGLAGSPPAAGPNDILTVLTPDDRGNVATERHYGGDILPGAPRNVSGSRPTGQAATGTLCTLSDQQLGTPVYTINHTRIEPTANADGSVVSKYAGVNVNVADVTIDRRTGLAITSRDTAGVQTTYEYNWAGRILAEKPAGRASTKYEYITPTNFEITVSKHDPSSSAQLTWSKYLLDAFGRVIRERVGMPSNSESVTNTVYDGVGRRTSVSDPADSTKKTSFTYDALGRLLTATAPDNSIVTYAYTGGRQKTRTSMVATTGTAESAQSVTETYDGLGRLIRVSEKSGPTSAAGPIGALVETHYEYDIGDRLSAVAMGALGSGPVQRRYFDYDGRGFLMWESQPESGITAYLYDVRGNVVGKRQSEAQSQFDVDSFYDAAGRLTRMESRIPNPPVAGPHWQPMKELEYGLGDIGSWNKGKVLLATRHNYTRFGDYVVTDSYIYGDSAGRLTQRMTQITEPTQGLMSTVITSTSYTPFDLPAQVAYPTCTNCGAPADALTRNSITRGYDRGRLTSVSGFVSGISYWPSGLRNVLQHSNGIADTQTVGVMSRPTAIKFGIYDRCVTPKVLVHPSSVTIAAGGSATLTVSAVGTGTLVYDWYESGQLLSANGSASFSATPSATTTYSVVVSNECGFVESHSATVMIGTCEPPSTGTLRPVLQPDGSWILTPDPISKQTSRTYQWKNLSTNAILGTSETQAIAALSETTAFRFTITDSCGTASSDIMISVPLPAPIPVQASSTTTTQITVTWPTVANATNYVVERRSGATWDSIVTVGLTTSYIDNAVQAGKTYAYRVKAKSATNASAYSNADVATTVTYTAAVVGQVVTANAAESTLTAVNLVRAAAGWPAMAWQSMLPSGDPLPLPGAALTARHIMACRARMNEALQALGATVTYYADPDVTLGLVRAAHINELQQRSK